MQPSTEGQISNALVQPCRTWCACVSLEQQCTTGISDVFTDGGFSDNRMGLDFLLV